MSHTEIVEHAGYLRDNVKIHAYREALERVVTPRSVVLDLGTGTGVLGLLALCAGASKVYAVDSGSIIGVAASIAEANGFGDRLVFLRESSTRLELPEPVDLVVCDQIGGLVYDAGLLEYYDDARRRFLTPDGALLPGGFRLLAAPVTAPVWDEAIGVWAQRPADLDMSPMFDLAVNTEYRVELGTSDFLGPPAAWAEIDADHVDAISGGTELTIERPGTINGIAGMFVASLCDGVELTNCPLLENCFDRWQNYYPLTEPLSVEAGDSVEIHFDIRPKSYLTSWTTTVRHGPERAEAVSRGSTILGQFLGPLDTAAASGSTTPQVSPLLAADRCALELVDGHRSVADIASTVWERHPGALRSPDDARRRVDHLLRRHIGNS